MVDIIKPDSSLTVALLHRVNQELDSHMDTSHQRTSLQRALRIFSTCTQAVIHAADEQALVQEVCRILVEIGGYRLAWVGLSEQGTTQDIHRIAQLGCNADYRETERIPGSADSPAYGSGEQNMRSVASRGASNSPHDSAHAPCQCVAMEQDHPRIALPLVVEQMQPFGILIIGSHAPEAFDATEEQFLTQLAGLLASGIVAMRERTRHRQAEEYLRVAYSKLEARIQDHTAALVRANRALQVEIAERQKVETAYRVLIEHSVQGIVVLQNGRIVFANPAVAAITGYAVEEILAMSQRAVSSMLYPDDRGIVVAREWYRQSGKSVRPHYTFRILTKDAKVRWLEAFSSRIEFHGTPAVQVACVDISERKQMEESMRQANEQLTEWVNELQWHNHDLKVLNELKDSLQSCTSFTDMCEVISRFGRKLFPGQTGALYLLTDHGHLAQAAAWGNSLPDQRHIAPPTCPVLDNGKTHLVMGANSEVCRRCPLGNQARATTFPYVCVPLHSKGHTVGLLHVYHTAPHTDAWLDHWYQLTVTIAQQFGLELANVKSRRHLHQQATRDPLTGLFNRRYLNEVLKWELQQGQQQQHSVGVILLDIDHFKQFNDTYGHDGGDVLLRAVGSLLRERIRGTDIACRYGGEEFILVLPGASIECTRARAEQIRLLVKELRVEHNGQPLSAITASMGVACAPAHGVTSDLIIKAADDALYRAKASGRDRVVVAR